MFYIGLSLSHTSPACTLRHATCITVIRFPMGFHEDNEGGGEGPRKSDDDTMTVSYRTILRNMKTPLQCFAIHLS